MSSRNGRSAVVGFQAGDDASASLTRAPSASRAQLNATSMTSLPSAKGTSIAGSAAAAAAAVDSLDETRKHKLARQVEDYGRILDATDVAPNYPAIKALFEGNEGCASADTVPNIHVSFELFETVQNRFANTKQVLERTKTDLLARSQQYSQLQAELQRVQGDYAVAKGRATEAEDRNTALHQQIAKLEVMIEQLQKEAGQIRTEMNVVQEQLVYREEELQASQNRVAEGLVTISQKEAAIATLRRELAKYGRFQRRGAAGNRDGRKDGEGGGEDNDGEYTQEALENIAADVEGRSKEARMKLNLADLEAKAKRTELEKNFVLQQHDEYRKHVEQVVSSLEGQTMEIHDALASHACVATPFFLSSSFYDALLHPEKYAEELRAEEALRHVRDPSDTSPAPLASSSLLGGDPSVQSFYALTYESRRALERLKKINIDSDSQLHGGLCDSIAAHKQCVEASAELIGFLSTLEKEITTDGLSLPEVREEWRKAQVPFFASRVAKELTDGVAAFSRSLVRLLQQENDVYASATNMAAAASSSTGSAPGIRSDTVPSGAQVRVTTDANDPTTTTTPPPRVAGKDSATMTEVVPHRHASIQAGSATNDDDDAASGGGGHEASAEGGRRTGQSGGPSAPATPSSTPRVRTFTKTVQVSVATVDRPSSALPCSSDATSAGAVLGGGGGGGGGLAAATQTSATVSRIGSPAVTEGSTGGLSSTAMSPVAGPGSPSRHNTTAASPAVPLVCPHCHLNVNDARSLSETPLTAAAPAQGGSAATTAGPAESPSLFSPAGATSADLREEELLATSSASAVTPTTTASAGQPASPVSSSSPTRPTNSTAQPSEKSQESTTATVAVTSNGTRATPTPDLAAPAPPSTSASTLPPLQQNSQVSREPTPTLRPTPPLMTAPAVADVIADALGSVSADPTTRAAAEHAVRRVAEAAAAELEATLAAREKEQRDALITLEAQWSAQQTEAVASLHAEVEGCQKQIVQRDGEIAKLRAQLEAALGGVGVPRGGDGLLSPTQPTTKTTTTTLVSPPQSSLKPPRSSHATHAEDADSPLPPLRVPPAKGGQAHSHDPEAAGSPWSSSASSTLKNPFESTRPLPSGGSLLQKFDGSANDGSEAASGAPLTEAERQELSVSLPRARTPTPPTSAGPSLARPTSQRTTPTLPPLTTGGMRSPSLSSSPARAFSPPADDDASHTAAQGRLSPSPSAHDTNAETADTAVAAAGTNGTKGKKTSKKTTTPTTTTATAGSTGAANHGKSSQHRPATRVKGSLGPKRTGTRAKGSGMTTTTTMTTNASSGKSTHADSGDEADALHGHGVAKRQANKPGAATSAAKTTGSHAATHKNPFGGADVLYEETDGEEDEEDDRRPPHAARPHLPITVPAYTSTGAALTPQEQRAYTQFVLAQCRRAQQAQRYGSGGGGLYAAPSSTAAATYPGYSLGIFGVGLGEAGQRHGGGGAPLAAFVFNSVHYDLTPYEEFQLRHGTPDASAAHGQEHGAPQRAPSIAIVTPPPMLTSGLAQGYSSAIIRPFYTRANAQQYRSWMSTTPTSAGRAGTRRVRSGGLTGRGGGSERGRLYRGPALAQPGGAAQFLRTSGTGAMHVRSFQPAIDQRLARDERRRPYSRTMPVRSWWFARRDPYTTRNKICVIRTRQFPSPSIAFDGVLGNRLL